MGRCTSSTPRDASTAATRSSAAACPSPPASRWPTSLQRPHRVTACFFGEGAVAEGEFHETMNLAALWRLPVLFCCENNLYAMGTALGRSESADRPRPEGLLVRHAGVGGRRHGRPRRRRCCPPGLRRDPGGRRSGVPRAADLPVPGPLDVRPRALPGPRRRSTPGGTATRSRCSLVVVRGGPAGRRRPRAHRGRGRHRDRRRGRVRRGRHVEPVEDLTRSSTARRRP